MMLWKSVVGKLWVTILLLVCFVLFILTVMLLEFFDNYHIQQTKQNLTSKAENMAHVIEDQELKIGLQISWELLDDVTGAMIVKNEEQYYYSPNMVKSLELPVSFFLDDKNLSKVIKENTIVEKISQIPGSTYEKDSRMLIIGVPIENVDGERGAVFIFQSLQVMQETTESTTKFIWLAAGVAIILTTIFAFFLSTRITEPLRKMREAAFEAARGKFDTKVPILTRDEIGELATAFNQMGRQLKFNMNALSQEKEQLSSILSSMADGVITFNRDGTILITNPPAERFLQHCYYELKKPLEQKEDLPAEVMELFQLAVSTETEQVGEYSVQGRTWVIIVSPLYNNRFIRGAVAVLRDMTEERQLDKLRKDFVANVSHELRTPIAMLQGYSEAIVDDVAETTEEKKEMARVIYDESLRMGRLVNELLDLARMEAGYIQPNYDEVEVGPYFQRIVRKFQVLAKEKGIELDYLDRLGENTFHFDPDRIEQVVTNLIDNAFRHTTTGGKVAISSTIDERGLEIKVSDSGSGIPEEDLPFIFERFYKADKARTRGRAGTGLGLSIAKHIIEGHHGHIAVQSKIQQGTTFTFVLPRTNG